MTASNLANHLLSNVEFRESYASRKFWRTRVDARDIQALFSWEQLNACLSFNRITNDRLRLSTSQGHLLENRRAFRAVKDRFGRPTDYLVINELHTLMQEGVTAVLEAVNELSVSVESVTEALGRDLGALSTANAYISFGNTSGFGAHNDDHDVIVLHVDGRKKWRFFKSARGEMATVGDLEAPSHSDVGEELIISAGDIMFIPKGTWHDVFALNESSLHLTVSVVYPTVSDFVGWKMKQDRFSVPFMDIRSSVDDRRTIAAACQSYFATFCDKDSLEIFLKTFFAGSAGSRLRANFPFLNQASPGDRFKRIPLDIVTLKSDAADALRETLANGRMHSLTSLEYKILSELPAIGSQRGDDIAEHNGGWTSAAPALVSLLKRGLIGKVD